MNIFKQTHKWKPNSYYHSRQSEPGSNSNEELLHTPNSSQTRDSL